MRRLFCDIGELKLCTETTLRKITSVIYDILGFNSCVICGRELYRICEQCAQTVCYLSPSCPSCSRHSTLGTIHPTCGDKRGSYDHWISLYRYTKNIKKILSVYKYESRLNAEKVLEKLITEYAVRDPFRLFTSMGNSSQTVFLLPVPMTKRKLKQRGVNPTYELAILFGRVLLSRGCIVKMAPDLLRKKEDTVPQAKKNRDKRLTSIARAYSVNVAKVHMLLRLFEGQKLALYIVDDVHTTGATATVLVELLTESLTRKQRESITLGFISLAKA